jgi:hypothetical protein
MQAFQNALSDCKLADLGFIGPKFTWWNGRHGTEHTMERLDRAEANREWCALYNISEVEVLPRTTSDHHPIQVTFSNSHTTRWPKTSCFRFEAEWTKNKEHGAVIKQVWRPKKRWEHPWQTIQSNLSGCRRSLKQWVRVQKNLVEQTVIEKLKELHSIQTAVLEDTWEEEYRLNDEINNLLEREDLKWRQRAKESWLQFGDHNTMYFHACASQKKQRSHILRIKDSTGRWCSTEKDVETAFVSYFSELFTAGTEVEMEATLDAVDSRITREMNQKLLIDFSEEEISAALNQMSTLKAPGQDGFSAFFYQANWATIKQEVCSAILHFLNTGDLDCRIHTTFIALIPKVQCPESVMDFRPISLCNVIYKLISKVLANRLKLVLPDIISCSQSAFIPGRLITDNIIAAFETMHTMQSRMWSKVGYMGVKLDMSKAYDRVEWKFLQAVMHRMGFDESWIRLVMQCVVSVKYSVLINGNPVGEIRPSRGIRQGDPISPYLFIICAEAFSALISKAGNNGVISGVPTSPRGPKISHLFFADDNILFCKANGVEWRRLMKIIGTYEQASGQKLNLQKTSVFFSRNFYLERRQEILRLSGLTETHRIDAYLGLPTFVGRSRTQAFQHIKAKVLQRLNNWKVHFLSQAGKEVLLKAVVQAIPTYCMGVFQLPISLCKEVNAMMQSFWWSHMSKTSKIHWMRWDCMGKSKAAGGLEFRDLVIFNQALLAKQG